MQHAVLSFRLRITTLYIFYTSSFTMQTPVITEMGHLAARYPIVIGVFVGVKANR